MSALITYSVTRAPLAHATVTRVERRDRNCQLIVGQRERCAESVTTLTSIARFSSTLRRVTSQVVGIHLA